MRLVHWSSDIVTKVHGRRQIDPLAPKHRAHALPGKPQGFWFSDETRGAHGWRAWCRAERFRSYGFRYEHEIKLSPNAKILYLRSHEDIDAFAAKYGWSLLDKLSEGSGRQTFSERFGHAFIDAIDWKKVAKKYHGIIITPYIWSQRMGDNHWYYTWDCASGCIWNARAIESITMVKEHKVPRKPTAWEHKRKRKRDMIRMAEASKKMVESMAEVRPRGPLDDALVKSADKVIESYGGKK